MKQETVMLAILTDALTYLKDGKIFCAEASNLEVQYPIRRLEFDGTHWFLYLKSHKTGKLAKFIRAREIRDEEGDLHWVEFDGQDIAKGCVLRIFND
jgi:hypothetical protein